MENLTREELIELLKSANHVIEYFGDTFMYTLESELDEDEYEEFDSHFNKFCEGTRKLKL